MCQLVIAMAAWLMYYKVHEQYAHLAEMKATDFVQRNSKLDLNQPLANALNEMDSILHFTNKSKWPVSCKDTPVAVNYL